jgi:hypothetical protein
MKYLHYVPRHDDAALVADACQPAAMEDPTAMVGRG